ncbi:MAG: BatA domain-containing protein [Planctomycetota bacterium]
MTFLNPGLLIAGALAAALPIIIHILMRRRRKPVPWAAMRFLQEAYRKQRKRLKLEQLLLLAARCLIVLLIGAALARPLLGGDTPLADGGARTVWILLDDSLTSATDAGDGSDFERHTQRATEIIEGLDGAAGDRVGLIVLSTPARAIVDPPSTDLDAVRTIIEELEPTDAEADLPGGAAIVNAAMADASGDSAVAVLSGFRSGSLGEDNDTSAMPSGGIGVTLAASNPVSASVTNLAVQEVRPLRDLIATGATSGPEPVLVGLRRYGPSDGPRRVELVVRLGTGDDAAEIGRREFVWPAERDTIEETVRADLALGLRALGRGGRTPPRRVVLSVELEAPGDGIASDNTSRRVLELRDRIAAAVIGPRRFGSRPSIEEFEPADWLRLALSPDPDDRAGIELTTLDPNSVDQARLAGMDAVWVTTPGSLTANGWAALASVARRGALVVICPDADEPVQLWTDQASAAFGQSMPTVAREAEDAETPLTLRPPERDSAGVLDQLAGELADLLTPVGVTRRVAIDPGESEPILVFPDGAPALVAFAPTTSNTAQSTGSGQSTDGIGFVLISSFAIDLAWTDLPAKPLVVPLVQELTRQGAGRAGASGAMVAGTPLPADPRSTGIEPAGETRRVGPDGIARHAGVWRVLDERGGERALLVYNPETEASDTSPTAKDDAAARLSRLFPTTGLVRWFENERGETQAGDALGADLREPLTLGLLLTLLAFVLAESALSRVASHATREAAA